MVQGRLKEIVQVQTKSFIYKIPITANVIEKEEYQKLKKENKIKSNAEEYIKDKMNDKLYHSLDGGLNRLRNLPSIFDTAPIKKYLQNIPEEEIHDESIGNSHREVSSFPRI